MTLQQTSITLVAVAGTNVAAATVAVSDKVRIRAVQVVADQGGDTPGAFYANVQLLANAFTGSQVVASLWAGYVRGNDIVMPMSIPNQLTGPGQGIVFQVTASANAPASKRFRCIVTTDDDVGSPAQGGSVFYEAPGSGQGMPVQIVLAQPAAGADYATQTVGAKSGWRVRGINGALTTAAAVAAREWTVQYQNSAGNIFVAHAAGTQAAAIVDNYSAAPLVSAVAGPAAGGRVMVPLSDVPLSSGEKIAFGTDSIQGADQWSAGIMEVYEWAMPA